MNFYWINVIVSYFRLFEQDFTLWQIVLTPYYTPQNNDFLSFLSILGTRWLNVGSWGYIDCWLIDFNSVSTGLGLFYA